MSQAQLFATPIVWTRRSADRWTSDDGRHVEYLPLFDSWQWSTKHATGTAVDRYDAQAQAEEAP